jgi:hypothetical protein
MKSLIVTCLFLVGFVMLTVWLNPFHRAPANTDSDNSDATHIPAIVFEQMKQEKEQAEKKDKPTDTAEQKPSSVWTEQGMQLMSSLWPNSTVTREDGDWLKVVQADGKPLWLLPPNDGGKDIPLMIIGCDGIGRPIMALLDRLDDVNLRIEVHAIFAGAPIQTAQWAVTPSHLLMPPNQAITRTVLRGKVSSFLEDNTWMAMFMPEGLSYETVEQVCIQQISPNQKNLPR